MIIYKVTNLINNKVYIGKTVSSLERRKIQHRSDAKKKLYKCIFHAAIDKYGEDNFCWEVVDRCLFSESLIELEKYYIKKFNSKAPHGYNMTDGGEGVPGRPMSERARLAAHQRKGKYHHTRQWKENKRAASLGERNPFFGKTHSSETKKKMSDKHRDCSGRNNPMFGVPMSAEHKEKLRLINSNRKASPETLRKRSESMKATLARKRAEVVQ